MPNVKLQSGSLGNGNVQFITIAPVCQIDKKLLGARGGGGVCLLSVE